MRKFESLLKLNKLEHNKGKIFFYINTNIKLYWIVITEQVVKNDFFNFVFLEQSREGQLVHYTQEPLLDSSTKCWAETGEVESHALLINGGSRNPWRVDGDLDLRLPRRAAALPTLRVRSRAYCAATLRWQSFHWLTRRQTGKSGESNGEAREHLLREDTGSLKKSWSRVQTLIDNIMYLPDLH